MHVATSAGRPCLRLASHVRACRTDGHVILLDLMHNQYLGIGGEASSRLSRSVEGWPADSESAVHCSTVVPADKLARQLMSRGLLTDRPASAAPHRTPEEVTSSLSIDGASSESRIDARRVQRFLVSAALAAAWLRCRSLDSIAKSVAQRHRRLAARLDEPPAPDAAFGPAAAYERLRPFAFTARDRCLHDSLALIGFLASEGVAAQWVIGVKASPFGAHSWVQAGGTVLNDQHDHVRRYRPILVV
jgi:hypothetical protein